MICCRHKIRPNQGKERIDDAEQGWYAQNMVLLLLVTVHLMKVEFEFPVEIKIIVE